MHMVLKANLSQAFGYLTIFSFFNEAHAAVNVDFYVTQEELSGLPEAAFAQRRGIRCMFWI